MLAGYGDFGAMTRIGYTVLGSNGGITFNNIPQTFQDLYLVVYGRSTHSSLDGLHIAVSGSNHSTTELWGDGSSATSARLTGQGAWVARVGLPAANATSGIFGAAYCHILNYANTTTNKTALIRTAADTNGAGATELAVGLWSSTSAITTLQVGARNGSLLAGTTAALYGVKASAA